MVMVCHIALVIEVAVVKTGRNHLWIPPGIDDVTLQVELDHGRRGLPNFFFTVCEVARVGGPAHNEHMVPRIDALASHGAGQPVIRQRLGPERVHLKLCRCGGRLPAEHVTLAYKRIPHSQNDSARRYDREDINPPSGFHVASFSDGF